MRKPLSIMNLDRGNNKVDEKTGSTHFAHRANRSTVEIVLAHKHLVAGVKTRGWRPMIDGIDTSKAFDTIKRNTLVNMLIDSDNEIGTINFI